MKNTWKKKVLIFFAIMLAFGMVFGGTASPVQAKSKANTYTSAKAKKAIKAYQKFLGQAKIKWSDKSYASIEFKFILVDINSDKVPELFLKCVGGAAHYEGYEGVYYFYKNKVKELTKYDSVYAYYPKKGVVEMRYFGMGGDRAYYQLSKKGKTKLLGHAMAEDDPYQKSEYEWNGKKVTKAKFDNLQKKATGNKKVVVKSSSWISNTAANRASMAGK